MNDALEMLEYTTILNQIAELTHTEAARRRALELRPTKDLALIHRRAAWRFPPRRWRRSPAWKPHCRC